MKNINEFYISDFQLSKDTKSRKLAAFMEELNNDSETATFEDRFKILTHELMNNLCLAVGDKAYRIIETEVYYFESDKHPDPYVHCSREQLTAGQWYFNGFGLDITFGNYNKKVYGGILIRGIKLLGRVPKYISGPSNVFNEIFGNFDSIVSNTNSFYLRELKPEIIEKIEEEPTSCARVGLTKKFDDTNNYFDKAYRFIVDLIPEHKFKEKERVVKGLLESKKIDYEQAKDILSYNIKLS